MRSLKVCEGPHFFALPPSPARLLNPHTQLRLLEDIPKDMRNTKHEVLMCYTQIVPRVQKDIADAINAAARDGIRLGDSEGHVYPGSRCFHLGEDSAK